MRLYLAIALITLSILLAIIFPPCMFFMACALSVASLRLERSLIAAFFALAAAHTVSADISSLSVEKPTFIGSLINTQSGLHELPWPLRWGCSACQPLIDCRIHLG